MRAKELSWILRNDWLLQIERERERERNATDWGSIAANVTSAITLGVTEYIRTNGEREIAREREREREWEREQENAAER